MQGEPPGNLQTTYPFQIVGSYPVASEVLQVELRVADMGQPVLGLRGREGELQADGSGDRRKLWGICVPLLWGK